MRHVETPADEVLVRDDGCLSRLRIGGQEFLPPPGAVAGGACFYQNSVLKLPEVHQLGDNVIVARREKATVRYDFPPDSITWPVTNATSQGSTRVWGPWAEGLQVWEATVGKNATRKVVLEASAATEAEVGKAREVAASPPPPPPTDPKGPMWKMKALSKPPATYPAKDFQAEGIRGLFYEGPPFRGRPTQVFAWVGIPKVEPGQKVPGMVLVHGGGGTAFESWVRLWNQRGYAAIAMDTCGCVPVGTYGNWQRHDNGGPPGWGGSDQIDWPREDQWTYHAVADAILAHSLLRSLPEVDRERVGLTGISWGGYLACIIAGADHRFKLAVPVYGCGFTNEHGFAGSVDGLGKERGDRWMRWWDPSRYLGKAPMPMFWVTGSNDFAYTFNALQKSYRLPKGPRALCIRLRMPHGHGPAGEGPKEIQVFADSILKGGQPLARVTGQGRDGAKVWATFESKVPVAKAELNFTKDTGKWQDRNWEAVPAQIGPGNKVTGSLPQGTRVYYLNLFDERDCVVSTEHEEVDL